MDDSFYAYYLRDVIQLLYERGMKARQDYLQKRLANDTTAAAFANGVVVGYFECLDTLMNKATSFELPIEAVDPYDLMNID